MKSFILMPQMQLSVELFQTCDLRSYAITKVYCTKPTKNAFKNNFVKLRTDSESGK